MMGLVQQVDDVPVPFNGPSAVAAGASAVGSRGATWAARPEGRDRGSAARAPTGSERYLRTRAAGAHLHVDPFPAPSGHDAPGPEVSHPDRKECPDQRFLLARSPRRLFDDSSREDRGARKSSLLVQSPRKVPGTPPHPASTCICAGQKGCDGAIFAGFQMSRKRPVAQLTCGNARPSASDLGKRPFGCFTPVPLDAAESPRKVPEGSQGDQAFFPGHAGYARRQERSRLRAEHGDDREFESGGSSWGSTTLRPSASNGHGQA